MRPARVGLAKNINIVTANFPEESTLTSGSNPSVTLACANAKRVAVLPSSNEPAFKDWGLGREDRC